jgi:hypothetical protein
MISAGEFVQASGSWINDRTHGVQFRAFFLKASTWPCGSARMISTASAAGSSLSPRSTARNDEKPSYYMTAILDNTNAFQQLESGSGQSPV